MPRLDLNRKGERRKTLKLELTDLEAIRWFIIENIMMNSDVMFSDERWNSEIDLPAVIASLYEVLHRVVADESYRYMFHHANKIGTYVDDNLFDSYLHELGEGD